MLERLPDEKIKGRGAVTNVTGRFEGYEKVRIHDGWDYDEEEKPLVTSLFEDTTRTIIATNDSPDIGFNQSINMYRGCEHGCIYCFARPTHAYLGLSPGLDFESRLFFKPRAGELLEKALRAKSYRLRADRARHQYRSLPAGRARQADYATDFAGAGAVQPPGDHRHQVGAGDARSRYPGANGGKEPGAGGAFDHHAQSRARPLDGAARGQSPARRLAAVRELAAAGVPVTVMAAPMIPALNDQELEAILARSGRGRGEIGGHAAGADAARDQAAVRGMAPRPCPRPRRACAEPDAPGTRRKAIQCRIRRPPARYRPLCGAMLQMRFRKATARLGLNVERRPLDCGQFTVPPAVGDQLGLF